MAAIAGHIVHYAPGTAGPVVHFLSAVVDTTVYYGLQLQLIVLYY
jgi:hypothetical protein